LKDSSVKGPDVVPPAPDAAVVAPDGCSGIAGTSVGGSDGVCVVGVGILEPGLYSVML